MENNTQNEDEEGLMEVKFTGGGGDFGTGRAKASARKLSEGKLASEAYAVSGFYPLEAV